MYDWVLFDADDTLYHFDSFSGLKKAFAGFGLEFNEYDFKLYQQKNKNLWVDYQNNKITAAQLQHRRFNHWAEQLNITPQTLNSAFLQAMADICQPLTGAVDLVKNLHGKVKLGIITNGFSELQKIRLERTGLDPYFDVLVISEQVGVAKPDRKIFDHALSLMGNPERERVLMVGDNPDSDIRGGLNAGFHVCWLNTDNKKKPNNINPHYQVKCLTELHILLNDRLIK